MDHRKRYVAADGEIFFEISSSYDPFSSEKDDDEAEGQGASISSFAKNVSPHGVVLAEQKELMRLRRICSAL